MSGCILSLSRAQRLALVEILGRHFQDKSLPQEYLELENGVVVITKVEALIAMVASAPRSVSETVAALQLDLEKEMLALMVVQNQRDRAWEELRKHNLQPPI